MLICPLAAAILFSGTCDVTTCMWNKQGRCGHGKPNDEPGDKLEIQRTIDKIKTYVTVGTFIEAKSGKSLEDLRLTDVPTQEEFISWSRSKNLDIAEVDYKAVVKDILNNL